MKNIFCLLLVWVLASGCRDSGPEREPGRPQGPGATALGRSAPAPWKRLAGAGPSGTLLARLMGPTPILEDLRQLVDGIGGRPTGSPALEEAVSWAVKRLRVAGLETVRTEPYRAPLVWLPGLESGSITIPRQPWEAPVHRRLRVAAMPFAARTGLAGVEAEVVDVGLGTPAGFKRAGTRVTGRWVLVHHKPMKTLTDLVHHYEVAPGIFRRAQKGGAVGVLWMSNRPRRLLYRHNATSNSTVIPLPAAVVEREGALRIARLLRAGVAVRVRLTVTSKLLRDAPFRNVVAEVRGGELPDEVIVLGAHLDSWDLGRGALDNGCNVALVIDAARQVSSLARAGKRAKRTLRFVLYTGEEHGFLGSWGEVRARRAELDRIRVQIVYDLGSGRTTGFSFGGRGELRPLVEAALAPVASLGPFRHTNDAFVGTDNFDYLLEGVPSLTANQAGGPYLPDYHAESDTLDKVDPRELKANAAIAGVIAFNLADAEKLPLRRQSRAEVEKLLVRTGVAKEMKTSGLWSAFLARRRGRTR